MWVMMAPTKNRTRPTAAATPISGTPMPARSPSAPAALRAPSGNSHACMVLAIGWGRATTVAIETIKPVSLSCPGLARHYHDGTRRGKVTDGRPGPAGGAIRVPPQPPAGGRLPDARLAERGRRCRAGGLAAAQPHRH